MPNKYYINDVTTPTIDLRSQIQKELRSLERKCNIRVANKETRFSDLKDNKNFYEHVEEEYEGALLLVFQKMKIKNYLLINSILFIIIKQANCYHVLFNLVV